MYNGIMQYIIHHIQYFVWDCHVQWNAVSVKCTFCTKILKNSQYSHKFCAVSKYDYLMKQLCCVRSVQVWWFNEATVLLSSWENIQKIDTVLSLFRWNYDGDRTRWKVHRQREKSFPNYLREMFRMLILAFACSICNQESRWNWLTHVIELNWLLVLEAERNLWNGMPGEHELGPPVEQKLTKKTMLNAQWG